MEKEISFFRICPDCKQEKHIISHHIITRYLEDYLIKQGYNPGNIRNLRNQLTVEICKDCEKIFHKRFDRELMNEKEENSQ